MSYTIDQILDDGFFDASEELEIADYLDRIAARVSVADGVTLKDAAVDIRYLVGLVRKFAKLGKGKVSDVAPVFYKLSDVEVITTMSASSVYRMASRNEFPSPIKLSSSGRSSAWIISEVDAWVDTKINTGR